MSEEIPKSERQLLIEESKALSPEIDSILDEEEKLSIQSSTSDSVPEIEEIIVKLGALDSQKVSKLQRKIEIMQRLQEIDSTK